MKIAILYGGRSGEHEVSLASAASVVHNLKANHKVTLIGITKAGSWRLQPDSVAEAAQNGSAALELKESGPEVLVAPGDGLRVHGIHGQSRLSIEIVFPVLHGTFGEDGTVQGLLECAGLPYVGADVEGSALGMDKEAAKNLWRLAGIPVVPSLTVDSSDYASSEALKNQAEAAFGWPMFIKPSRTGSSVGTSRVASPAGWEAAIKEALSFDTVAIVEPFIQAREIECSVIGNESPRAFEPGEVAPTHEFYDYEAKYIDPDGARLIIPAPIDADVRTGIKDLAIRAYKTLGLQGMARVDLFLDKSNGSVYVNEVNTIPGFTSISMFPKMCEADGLAYPELLDELIALGMARHTKRNNLKYERS
ncbi:MAG: D-alanine--D-alanine ligase [Spirochaetales bacterium]|nr:MAG: D-alanine--D-alanine ligase [Spirochaetales bacterium]